MTDRELLELAAKAAGIIGIQKFFSNRAGVCIASSEIMSHDYIETPIRYWNPLTDDGDALRLAVKLGIRFDAYDDLATVEWSVDEPYDHFCNEEYTDDGYAATRRAIVRAAAEIGKTK